MSTEVDVCTVAEARELTDQIRGTLEFAHRLIIRAFKVGVWDMLGYETWDAYCLAEFEGERMIRLPRDQRREIVAEMRAEGMSTRAIASGLGVSKNTVTEDMSQTGTREAEVTGTDGKTYAPKPAPAVEEDDDEIVEGEIVDDGGAPFSWSQAAAGGS